ncbi:MAG: T9SS type A sorting domain-containing protein [Bacteroidetes bacterium]|nr:T9SS type A sorting domain-containing protein [Bacteroidota bacterium]
MKYILQLCFLLAFSPLCNAQYVTIPDTNFLNRINLYVPSAVVGNTIDTTDAALLSLQVMSLQNAGISDITGIEYFHGLIELNCQDNNLTSLPRRLPALQILNVGYNPISVIDTLPLTLRNFYAVNCGLTEIASFPDSISDLLIGVNNLTSLPTLPHFLFTLDCGDNLIDSLPELPPFIQVLVCTRNRPQCLPTLPDTLQQLYAYQTATCLPNLPSHLGLSDIGFQVCDSNFVCPPLTNNFANQKQNSEFEIFPNPSQGNFTIKMNSEMFAGKMELFSLSGVKVFETTILNTLQFIDYKLLPGVYFIRVLDEKRQLTSKLIVN